MQSKASTASNASSSPALQPSPHSNGSAALKIEPEESHLPQSSGRTKEELLQTASKHLYEGLKALLEAASMDGSSHQPAVEKQAEGRVEEEKPDSKAQILPFTTDSEPVAKAAPEKEPAIPVATEEKAPTKVPIFGSDSLNRESVSEPTSPESKPEPAKTPPPVFGGPATNFAEKPEAPAQPTAKPEEAQLKSEEGPSPFTGVFGASVDEGNKPEATSPAAPEEKPVQDSAPKTAPVEAKSEASETKPSQVEEPRSESPSPQPAVEEKPAAVPAFPTAPSPEQADSPQPEPVKTIEVEPTPASPFTGAAPPAGRELSRTVLVALFRDDARPRGTNRTGEAEARAAPNSGGRSQTSRINFLCPHCRA